MMRRSLWIGLVSAALLSACNTSKSESRNAASGTDEGQSKPAAAPAKTAGTAPAAPAAALPGTLEPLAANPGEHRGTHRWSAAFGSPVLDAARAVAIDPQGHVAITGYYASGTDFGDGQKVEAQKVDAFVSKYAPDGKHLWTVHFGGPGEDTGNAVAFDPQGNVVVAGLFYEAMTVGDIALTGMGSDDIFIAKLGLDGTPLWAHRAGGADSDTANGLAVAADGMIYLTGSFKGSMRLAGEVTQSKGNEDVLLLKLDSQGGVLWSKRFGERYRDFGQRVAVDGRGHVLLLAEFTEEVAFGGEPLTSAGNRDLALVKLDADGEHLWSRRFGSPFNELGLGMAVDPAGNVALTGSFDNEITFGGDKLTSRGESDVFVAKLTPDGEHLWSRSFGAAREDIGHGLATDKYGNVAVTGWFWSEVDFGGGALAAEGMNKDVFLLKLSAKGEHLWSRRFGAQDHDQGRGVAMTPDGVLAAIGIFRFTIDLGGKPLASVREAEDQAPPADAYIAVFEP